MKLNFSQTLEYFKNDLMLTKFYLLNEAIEDPTKKTIKLLSINLIQKLQASEAGKSSKLKTLLASAVEAKRLYDSSFNIQAEQSINDYKKLAGNVASAVEFYFLVEDLFLVLGQQLVVLKEQNDSFISSSGENNTEPKQVDENPAIDLFLEPNDLKKFKQMIFKLLNNQNSLTKDVQTIKFQKVSSQFDPQPILDTTKKNRIVFELTKLTYKEYENLVGLINPMIGVIKNIRQIIGSGLPEEIREKILGVPVKK